MLNKRIPHSNIKYFTKEIIDAMPPLYGTEGTPEDDKIVQVKFFFGGSFTWYVTEASAVLADTGEQVALKDVNGQRLEDITLFGLFEGDYYPEWGYASFNEISSERTVYGTYLERDKHFPFQPIKEVN